MKFTHHFLTGMFVVAFAIQTAAATPLKHRNIVFILADDHRYDALGFLGHPFLETPNLDALARTGCI